ncbi:MAG: DegV family protein [Angelakisella sp.]
MKIGIIGDSCCDLTPEMIQELQAQLVPLKITVGEETFVDDRDIDLAALRGAIHNCKTAASTACPSPEDYAQAMRQSDASMVITISAKLSGSHNAAMVARDLVLEETPEKKIHVFDSGSASSGEVQIALQIRELEEQGLEFNEIVQRIETKLTQMHTLFILEDLSTLMKNGRLNKVVGTVATLLSLRPIMSDNGHGEIAMLDKVRGTQKALARLTELVVGYTANCAKHSVRLVLSHCNCLERGEELRAMLLAQCPALSEVLLVATRGLSTVYANEGGVIAAFHGA